MSFTRNIGRLLSRLGGQSASSLAGDAGAACVASSSSSWAGPLGALLSRPGADVAGRGRWASSGELLCRAARSWLTGAEETRLACQEGTSGAVRREIGGRGRDTRKGLAALAWHLPRATAALEESSMHCRRAGGCSWAQSALASHLPVSRSGVALWCASSPLNAFRPQSRGRASIRFRWGRC